MNQLVRGLLAPDPEQRLSASKALQLPVFDKFRGNQLPAIATQKPTFLDDDDTEVFDEGSPVMHSIKSLEGRSIVLRRPMDGVTSPSPSAFSIRMEGGSSIMSKNKKPIGPIKASALTKYVSEKGPDDLIVNKNTLMAKQESFDASSKFSADDKMSPMQSPKKLTMLKGLGNFAEGPIMPKKVPFNGMKPLSNSDLAEK